MDPTPEPSTPAKPGRNNYHHPERYLLPDDEEEED
jgi:hypothetical protein